MARFKAVVFDWAGTLVDFGSFAPMGAFVEAFARFGVEITVAQARGPMGMGKRDHIRTLINHPAVAAAWAAARGASPTEADVDAVYEVFVPMNEAVAARHATLVPGALEAVAALRVRGLRIGSTTGYTRSIMREVLPAAAAQGLTPDCVVCADEVPAGRPAPFGMYRCFLELGVYPPSSVIKVDDTEPGIGEGVAAGCVTVGVALSGNHAALAPDEVAALPPDELEALRERVTGVLQAAGADHVIDTVADLPALVERLEVETTEKKIANR